MDFTLLPQNLFFLHEMGKAKKKFAQKSNIGWIMETSLTLLSLSNLLTPESVKFYVGFQA